MEDTILNTALDCKLVRDKIPAIIAANGQTARCAKVLDNDFLNELLVLKLREEVSEFVESFGLVNIGIPEEESALAELADIYTVILACVKQLGFSEEDFMNKYNTKLVERGGFKDGIILCQSKFTN